MKCRSSFIMNKKGDKTYDMIVDGRRKFVSPSYNDLYYSYTFTEQSFEAESDAEYPE